MNTSWVCFYSCQSLLSPKCVQQVLTTMPWSLSARIGGVSSLLVLHLRPRSLASPLNPNYNSGFRTNDRGWRGKRRSISERCAWWMCVCVCVCVSTRDRGRLPLRSITKASPCAISCNGMARDERN